MPISKLPKPDTCPICKSSIEAKELHTQKLPHNNYDEVMYSVYQCSKCKNPFLSCYLIPYRAPFFRMYLAPNPPIKETFDESIHKLSPSFVKSYNEALAAENIGLYNLAGIGYRRALEFLVKDFAISRNPSEADKIKNMHLCDCIKTKLDNDKLKIIAKAAAWIGNDYAHYLQKYKDKDLSDMKKYISSIRQYISLELVALDAYDFINQ